MQPLTKSGIFHKPKEGQEIKKLLATVNPLSDRAFKMALSDEALFRTIT